MADRHKNRTLASEAERLRAIRSASLNISPLRKLDEVSVERRARTCASAVEFAKEYCTDCDGAFLRQAPPRSMECIIRKMQEAVESGIPYHIEMPRGHGKSSYVKCVVAWAIATGRRHFLMVVAANGKKACSMLRDIWNLFQRSPRLIIDFPEICDPIVKLEGKTQRCKSVLVDGEPTDMKVAVDEVHFPRVKGFDNSGAILIAVGFKANSRGAVVGCQRPDLMIFDDLQDREMAENPERVSEALDLIVGDFMGSAGHQGGMAVFMTSTPIAPDDLSERISRDPFWTTEVYKMLDPLPDEWLLENHGLWGEYVELMRSESIAKRKPFKACNRFYRSHRREMDKGAKVLNNNNYTPNEVSAIQHAMNLLIKSGEKNFDAEYQMTPHQDTSVFRLHPSMILGRVRSTATRGWLLPDAVMTIAATDINPAYGLSTVVMSFKGDRTAFVTDFFITKTAIDVTENDTEFFKHVYNAIGEVGHKLQDSGIKIDAWGIDCSGSQWKPATAFAANSVEVCGIKAYALAGKTDKEFNPRISTRRRGVGQNDTVLCWNKARGEEIREHIYFNKDHYEESAQKAWVSEIGAPGGLTLFDGAMSSANLNEFAVQVCAEHLVSKVEVTGDKCKYTWKETGKHDLGDGVYMCFALAGYFNIKPDGEFESKREEDSGDDFDIL